MSKLIDTEYMEAYHQGILAALNRRQPKRNILTSTEAHNMFNQIFNPPIENENN